jgi:RNA polymerase sigma-70 factor (ECF subfamily)
VGTTGWHAELFEENRPRLRAVAYRVLGSASDADDAVQETWLRLRRTDCEGIDNLAGWLTTVVARVSLDMLRARRSKREEPGGLRPAEAAGEGDPEREAMLASSVGVAVLVVLERLAPAERVAFVLHDMFGVPFDEIAPIVGRSPAATRQLASRARRRVRGSAAADGGVPADRQHVVDAFLTASRDGDLEALVELLDPDVVLRADAAAAAMGADEVRGSAAVARTFAGRAKAAQPALLDGSEGLVWVQRGAVKVAFLLTISDGRIAAIDLVADSGRLQALEVDIIRA